jgi:hypothetical protein
MILRQNAFGLQSRSQAQHYRRSLEPLAFPCYGRGNKVKKTNNFLNLAEPGNPHPVFFAVNGRDDAGCVIENFSVKNRKLRIFIVEPDRPGLTPELLGNASVGVPGSSDPSQFVVPREPVDPTFIPYRLKETASQARPTEDAHLGLSAVSPSVVRRYHPRWFAALFGNV